MPFQSRRLTPHIGIEVTGLDFTRPIDAATRKALYDLWVDGAVLVIRDQKLSPPQFEALARNFGEPMMQQAAKLVVEGHPLVGTLSNRDLPMVDGKMHVRGENFHTDHSNYPAPPKATMLCAVELPSHGGDTQFVDVRQAYDELPEATKEKILPLFSHHVFESSHSPRKMVPMSPEELARIPHSVHPLVLRHADTGRAALYLNTGRMEGIEGMPPEEAYALIDELYAHATQRCYEYRHQWKHGDVVIWDNRSVMHQANADFDPAEYRFLYRIMLYGSAPQPYATPARQQVAA